jgi:hypothetical protein
MSEIIVEDIIVTNSEKAEESHLLNPTVDVPSEDAVTIILEDSRPLQALQSAAVQEPNNLSRYMAKYPAPAVYALPSNIPDLPPLPTQAELDVEPFKYTWEEIKGFISEWIVQHSRIFYAKSQIGAGDFMKLDWRSRPMELRYIVWGILAREKFGSIGMSFEAVQNGNDWTPDISQSPLLQVAMDKRCFSQTADDQQSLCT